MIAPSLPGSPPGSGRRAGLVALLALVAAQLVAGVLVGLLWLYWAPASVSYLLSDGSGGSLVIPDESEAQVAGDGRFVVLTLLTGLLFGVLAWTLPRLRRHRGPVTVAVLGAGSVLGSLVALATGRLLTRGTSSPAINSAFHPKLTLHASSALWLQALAAVLAYTALVGLSSDPGLGRAGTEPVERQPPDSQQVVARPATDSEPGLAEPDQT